MKIDEFDVEVYKAVLAGLSIAAVFLVFLYVLSEWIYPSPPKRHDLDSIDRCQSLDERCVGRENQTSRELQPR